MSENFKSNLRWAVAGLALAAVLLYGIMQYPLPV